MSLWFRAEHIPSGDKSLHITFKCVRSKVDVTSESDNSLYQFCSRSVFSFEWILFVVFLVRAIIRICIMIFPYLFNVTSSCSNNFCELNILICLYCASVDSYDRKSLPLFSLNITDCSSITS